MGIKDNIENLFTGEISRNTNSAIITGLLFFTGWWVLIDALCVDPKHEITTGQAFIGVFGTVSFIMVNTVKNSHISEDNMSENGTIIARVWLVVGFLIGFSSIVAALWVMIADYVNNPSKSNKYGVAILMENVLIFTANLVYKFGRNEGLWPSY
ncbi:TMEM50A family protein [Megaselia abdita]